MHNFAFDKPKNQLLNRRNSIIHQQEDFRRSIRTISNSTPIPTSFNSQQTIKVMQRLQKIVKDQRQRRQQIQAKYAQFKQRVVNRQKEFHKILTKLDPHMPGDSRQEQFEEYIEEIYKKILCTFEAFNQKARSLLDDRYSELYRMMERRIDILMQKMDKELAKYRKVSISERKQIQQAIRDIASIAAQTENENAQFRTKNQSLEFKLCMLNDEKKLLVEQITALKKYIKANNQQKNQPILNKEQKGLEKNFFQNIESIMMESVGSSQLKHRRTLTSQNHRYQQGGSKNKFKSIKISKDNTINVKNHQMQLTSQHNTINHLKQQLAREKNKNAQLIKFSLELQAKQRKIRELIEEGIEKLITKTSERQWAQERINKKYQDSKMSNSLMSEKLQSDKKYIQINCESKIQDQKNHLTCQLCKTYSFLVSQINKVLRLPQNDNTNLSCLNQKLNVATSNKNSKQTIPIVQVNQKYRSQSKLKQPSRLFYHYSPLDLVDITKSIDIG